MNPLRITEVSFKYPEIGDGTKSYFGGEDQILAWCREGSYFHDAPAVPSCASSSTCSGAASFVDAHDFEYDLVVIGGK